MQNNTIEILSAENASFSRQHRSKRLGLIVPSMNTVCEAEWAEILREIEEPVSLHVSRIDLYATPDIIDGTLPKNLMQAIDALTEASVDAVAYAGFSSDMPTGRLAEVIQRQADVLSVVANASIVVACQTLGLSRVAIASPYGERLLHHEREYFIAAGLDVVRAVGLGIGDPAKGGKSTFDYADIARLSNPALSELAAQAVKDTDAEILLMPGTNLPSSHLLPQLERQLRLPVISGNLALLWHSLRQMGVRESLSGYGILMDRG